MDEVMIDETRIYPSQSCGARTVGAPLGRTRCFIVISGECVEVWVVQWPCLVTDGASVFEVEPGRLVPGTL